MGLLSDWGEGTCAKDVHVTGILYIRYKHINISTSFSFSCSHLQEDLLHFYLYVFGM